MNRAVRACVLLALAAVLGGLAAADVAGREAALRTALGPPVPVVVARTDIPAGAALTPGRLAVRRVPRRYAPAVAFAGARELAGARAAVAIARGTDMTAALVDAGARSAVAVRPGERVVELVAHGSPALIAAGGRVDVLVTRERGDGRGETRLALEDAEVLDARPVAASDDGPPGRRVAVALRVSVREAVYLTAAQSFARELRVLSRAPGDRRRGAEGTVVGADLG